MNELDKVLMTMQRSHAGAPQLYRQLVTGELCFLLPYHPEMAEGGRIQVQNGSLFPFSVLTESDGTEVVPIFSCEARVEESLRVIGGSNRFLYGTMPAVQVLELIGKVGLAAVLNRGCSTGELTFPPELLRDLADGSIFGSTGPSETKRAAVTTLNPADYPTDLVQRVFEFIRPHPAFRAAWIFLLPDEEPPSAGNRKYQLIFLMSPPNEVLRHDLNLALHCSPPEGIAFEIGTLDETDTVQIVTLFAKAQPFYIAQDFKKPKRE